MSYDLCSRTMLYVHLLPYLVILCKCSLLQDQCMCLFVEEMYTSDEAVFHCLELLSSLAQSAHKHNERTKSDILLAQHHTSNIFIYLNLK